MSFSLLFFDYNAPPELSRRIIFAIAAANSLIVLARLRVVCCQIHLIFFGVADGRRRGESAAVHMHSGQHGQRVTANSARPRGQLSVIRPLSSGSAAYLPGERSNDGH